MSDVIDHMRLTVRNLHIWVEKRQGLTQISLYGHSFIRELQYLIDLTWRTLDKLVSI